MKLYAGLVNTTLTDGTHHYTEISFIIKRHRKNAFEQWTYTVKVKYAYAFDDVKNEPYIFQSSEDWNGAILTAFKKDVGTFENTALEHLHEITL